MDHEALESAVADYSESLPFYEECAEAMRVLVKQVVIRAGYEIDTVSARAKEPSSLRDKLDSRADYEALADVADLVGVRIVARYASDVGGICQLLHGEFEIIEDETHGERDPQSFGYSSRHMLLRLTSPRKDLLEWQAYSGQVVEVQVRSILQHAWASISHGLDYKSGSDVPEVARRRLFRVAALLETGDELFDQFREQVEDARSEYERGASSDQWRELPINMDSLLAAADHIPLVDVQEAAIESGWRAVADENVPRPPELSRLVSVAAAIGLTDVGEIADTAEQVSQDGEWLTRFADDAEREGYRPYAVPSDVLTLRLLATSGSKAAIRAAQETHLNRHLLSAAQAE